MKIHRERDKPLENNTEQVNIRRKTPLTSKAASIRATLCKQVTAPVLWETQMARALDSST